MPASTRSKLIVVASALALLTVAVFGQVWRFGFIQFDDPLYVWKNPHLLQGITPASLKWAFVGIHAANWHPLTSLSHLLDVQLFGTNAGSHHLINLLFHTANVILLFAFLWKTTGSTWRSTFVVALFAIHPLRVESVAWISERKDVLSGFFWMLTLLAYWRYVKKPSGLSYASVAGAFVCALLSKPMAITLPLILLLLDFWPLNRLTLFPGKGHASFVSESGIELERTSSGRVLIEKLPLLLLCIGSAILTLWAQQTAVISRTMLPIKIRILNSILAYVAYLQKTLWPAKLAMFYPMPRTFYLEQVGAALLLLLVITIGIFLWRRRLPYAFTGWLWYLITLVPVIGVIQVGQQAYADRYTYLSTIGVYLMIVWTVARLAERFPVARLPVIALSILVIGTLSVAAARYASLWKSDEPLLRHTLALTSNNNVAHCVLGSALVEQGKYDEAILEYKQALAILPGYTDAHVDLGIAYLHLGKNEEAAQSFRTAVKFAPESGDNHLKLAIALEQLREWREALEEFKTAVRLEPDSPVAHSNLAVAELRRGHVDEAIAESQEALRLYPNNVERLQALAWLWATDRDPKRRKPAEALKYAEKACRLTQFKNPHTLQVLAAAQAANSEFTKAAQTAEKAMGLLNEKDSKEYAKLKHELTIALELYKSGLPYFRH